MTLTAPPTAPVTTDPSTFAVRADALVAWFATHVTEENALITAMAGTFVGTSTTSLTPSVASKTFTASTGMAFQIGQPVMMASAATPGIWMSGQVAAYNSVTGAMTVNVAVIGTASAKADWIISLVPTGYTVGQIAGTATNDSATAGNIGEYISSSVASGSAVVMTTATPANITSISLTAGDWDLDGNVWTSIGAGATMTAVEGWISTTSASAPTRPNSGGDSQIVGSFGAGINSGFALGNKRISLAATTTVYLSGSATFTGGATSLYGFIGARRAR